MKLTFRQGIARYQTDVNGKPIFLQFSAGSGSFIDLIVAPDPTMIVFAHKNANYIVEQIQTVTQAWGPFSGTSNFYLYWDINLLTGALTRAYTLFPPIYAGSAPTSPAIDQHWFDLTCTTMRVWAGVKWVDTIRVFAGLLKNGAILIPYQIGTQAGINGAFYGGNIILDVYNVPLRQSDGTFVTSSSALNIVNNSARTVRFESEVMEAMALEPVPMFSLVQVQPGRRVVLARSNNPWSRISGIVLDDLYINEVGNIVVDGLVRNANWAFPADSVNRPVFCGTNGEITITPPTAGVVQIAGFVYDTDAVYMDVQQAVILDDVTTIAAPAPPPPPPPNAAVANFYAPVTSGPAPLTVSFINTTTNMPATYQWDFTGNGTDIDSTLESPTYTYITPGTYDVTLTASNIYGGTTTTKTGYIIVQVPPETNTTSLSVNLGGPAQTTQNASFQVSIAVTNTGLITATNVTRVITIPDVRNQSITLTNTPTGTILTRDVTNHSNVYTFPVIAALPSDMSYGPVFFTVKVPPVSGTIAIYAKTSCDQPNVDLEDNTASLSIGIQP